MKAICDLYVDEKDKHVCVETLILDAQLKNQVSILQVYQDVNNIIIFEEWN